MDKKNKAIDEMDPILKAICGFEIGPDEKPLPNQQIDPIADAVFRDRWGFDRPKADGGNPAPAQRQLSRTEIAEALSNLQKHLGAPGSGFRSTKELITKLASAAREHLEPDNPVRSWLIAYAEGDQQAMRSAIAKLVAASKTEIVEYVRRAKDPQMQTGAPGTTIKKGNWTFVYDETGSLTKCYEGDDEPFIFKN